MGRTIFAVVAAVLAAAIVAVLFTPWLSDDDPTAGTVLEDTRGESVTFNLEGRGPVADTGVVTLVGEGDRTRMGVQITNPSGLTQPVHIHPGRCGATEPETLYDVPALVNDPGALEAVVTTTLPVALDELLGKELAVEVHRGREPGVVACGNVPDTDALAP